MRRLAGAGGAAAASGGIAVDIYGADEVAANWYSDGGMRSQIRRWIPKAQALVDGGWRDFVPRHGSVG